MLLRTGLPVNEERNLEGHDVQQKKILLFEVGQQAKFAKIDTHSHFLG
jgi:hypothetical protein